MNRIGLLVLLVVGCTCETVIVKPVTECGRECYSGFNEDVRSPCKYGILACAEDGGEQVCQGEVFPTAEVCDGADNDCDGQTDEFLPGCCRPTGPEVCDGYDNDCNGLVDEITGDVAFCYEGVPRSTVTNGPCRPGVNRCVRGQMECSGQVLPQAETCDGVDNDCDGQIDEELAVTMPIDIVFVMDNSGSMTTIANSIAMSVTGFAARYANDTAIRWALIAAPPETPLTPGDPYWIAVIGPTLITDFTDANSFATFFLAQKAIRGSGDEPTLDAMHGICSGTLGLTWNQGAKRVIVMLSDESPQSYNAPYKSVAGVVGTCAGYTTLLFVNATDKEWQALAMGLSATLKDIRAMSLPQDLTTIVNNSLCR